MSISETAELYRQRFKLWFKNSKWNYQAFYSIYRSRGIRKLVIPVGITRPERVKFQELWRSEFESRFRFKFFSRNIISLISNHNFVSQIGMCSERTYLLGRHIFQWPLTSTNTKSEYLTALPHCGMWNKQLKLENYIGDNDSNKMPPLCSRKFNLICRSHVLPSICSVRASNSI